MFGACGHGRCDHGRFGRGRFGRGLPIGSSQDLVGPHGASDHRRRSDRCHRGGSHQEANVPVPLESWVPVRRRRQRYRGCGGHSQRSGHEHRVRVRRRTSLGFVGRTVGGIANTISAKSHHADDRSYVPSHAPRESAIRRSTIGDERTSP